MKATDRQKMCANCDGRIPYDVSICPYCASEQPETAADAGPAPLFKQQSLEESLSSLYRPPYPSTSNNSMMYQEEPVQEQVPMSEPTAIAAARPQEEAKPDRASFLALLLLSVAGNLFVLGLLQFFFSHGGILRLEWSSSNWFIYCLSALPIFYMGFRFLKKN